VREKKSRPRSFPAASFRRIGGRSKGKKKKLGGKKREGEGRAGRITFMFLGLPWRRKGKKGKGGEVESKAAEKQHAMKEKRRGGKNLLLGLRRNRKLVPSPLEAPRKSGPSAGEGRNAEGVSVRRAQRLSGR